MLASLYDLAGLLLVSLCDLAGLALAVLCDLANPAHCSCWRASATWRDVRLVFIF